MVRLFFSIVFFASTASTASTAVHADQFICTTNKITGFSYDKNKKEWVNTNFIAEDKFVIKQVEPTSINNYSGYEVTKIGDKISIYRCSQSFNDSPIIQCTFKGPFFPNIFYYSKVTGSFQEYSHGTLVTGQTSDTPYIAIGKCSSF